MHHSLSSSGHQPSGCLGPADGQVDQVAQAPVSSHVKPQKNTSKAFEFIGQRSVPENFAR